MHRLKVWLAGRNKTIILLGLALALGLVMGPIVALAYGRSLDMARLWPAPKQHTPVALAELASVTPNPTPTLTPTPEITATPVEETPEPTETPLPEDEDAVKTFGFMVLRGPISALPKEGYRGTWIIGGQPVRVTEDTHLNEQARHAVVGDQAYALLLAGSASGGMESKSGTDPGTGRVMVAHSITVVRLSHSGQVLGKVSKVGDREWVVGGVTVKVDDETQIVGKPKVGVMAYVYGKDSDGGLVAERIVILGSGGWLQKSSMTETGQQKGKADDSAPAVSQVIYAVGSTEPSEKMEHRPVVATSDVWDVDRL